MNIKNLLLYAVLTAVGATHCSEPAVSCQRQKCSKTGTVAQSRRCRTLECASVRLAPGAKKLLTAHAVQIDTGMAYYRNRSAESIASELELNGFNGVYYYLMAGGEPVPGLIAALQRRGIPVGLMTLPSLVYLDDAALARLLPPGHREWLMQFTGTDMEQYRFIGFIYPEYRKWYKKYLVDLMLKHKFDGFTFAEIMYPIYDGPERKKVFYGCVSDNFKRAFMAASGNNRAPDFTDPDSADYFRVNKELYRQWVDFRVKTINDFYDDIVNSPEGIRSNVPGVAFATWTLGINIPDGVEKLRTWEGNDIADMISRVRPDIHIVQTHAPDWTNPVLPADYPDLYKPFFATVRQASPTVKIGMQADFGSIAGARRSPEWREEFYRSCRRNGVATTTYYEFSLRYEVYATAPRFKRAALSGDTLDLYFDQRLGEKTFKVMRGRAVGGAKIVSAEVDGNILRCRLDKQLPRGEYRLAIDGVCDAPELRFPSTHLPPLPRGPENVIPGGETATVKVL